MTLTRLHSGMVVSVNPEYPEGSSPIARAAKYVGKSTRTIKAWRAEGVDITDFTALEKHSQEKDARSRGISRQRALVRIDKTTALSPTRPLESAPFTAYEAMTAMRAVLVIKERIALRLEDLRAAAQDEHEFWLAEGDLLNIARIADELDLALSSFDEDAAGCDMPCAPVDSSVV